MAVRPDVRKAPAEIERILGCVDRRQIRNWRTAAKVLEAIKAEDDYRFGHFAPSHAVELARCAPRADWALWAEWVEDTRASVKDLRAAIVNKYKNLKAPTVAARDLASLPRSKFRTLLVDPPWPYDGWASGEGQNGRHYPSMTLEEIVGLPVAALAAEQAHLHLWTTTTFLREARWGFEFKSVLVWCKDRLGTGNFWRMSHEYLLLGVRDGLPMLGGAHRSWIEAPRGAHSEKPALIRRMIEEVSPPPRLELFARSKADGWTAWGNEVEAA